MSHDNVSPTTDRFTETEKRWLTRALFGMAATFGCGLVAGAALMALILS